MSYTINTTSGNVLLTLLDGTTDTSTGLTLIGRNYTNYGLLQNDNFVRLLENFADNVPPGQSVGFSPIAGTLWYDTANQVLKEYDGANWYTVSGRIVSSSIPTPKNIGDQWYNTSTGQLSQWTGTVWQLIGPAYTTAQGKSGPVVESVTGTDTNVYTVVNTYTNGNLVSVTSANTFTPTGTLYSGISTIQPGVNLPTTNVVNGTATNSLSLGGATASNYARTDINSAFTKDVAVSGNIVLTNANISYSSGLLALKNSNLNGNITLYVNTGALVNALTVNGSTGLITVAGDPTNNLGIATKEYVDNSYTTITSSVSAQISTINGNVTQLRADYFANINIVNNALTSAISLLQAQTATNVSILNSAIASNVTTINANIATLNANLGTVIYTSLPLKANVNSPALTGSPTAPTPAGGDNSLNIATTAFVSNVYTTLYNGYTVAVSQEASTRASAIATAVAPLANIASPVFTGTPAAPTPAVGDSTTTLATTQFVGTAVANGIATFPHITYGTSAPINGQGKTGDFYFQYV